MSNISYNFLTESFLFLEADSNYSKRTLTEIDDEINKYKNYINNNLTELNNEIYKEYNFIQPLNIHSNLPSLEDLLQGCIFLDTYIIDDPIYRFNIQQKKMGNLERLQMGGKALSDEDIKNELRKIIIYMKELTPGVNISLGYIKFFPLGLFLKNYFTPTIRIPDISTSSIDPNVYKWFQKRIILINLDKNVSAPDIKISNRIALSFDGDENNKCMIIHYQNTSLNSLVGNHAIIQFDGNYIPTEEEYNNWVTQEKIKFIKERIYFFSYRDYLCSYFNSPICLTNNFENQFYRTNFNNKNSHFHNLGFNLDIPGLQNVSFEKAMEIRNYSHSGFSTLQKKIKTSSKALRSASDFKTYSSIIDDIKQDYLDEIKSTRIVLDSLKNIFSVNNLCSYALSAESYYTGTASPFTTGVTVINAVYNAGKVIKENISNPMYFLKKFSKYSK